MTKLSGWILVAALVIGAGCIGGKRTRTGTNIDPPSDDPRPRTHGGETQALISTP
jgi:hypothetical protein